MLLVVGLSLALLINQSIASCECPDLGPADPGADWVKCAAGCPDCWWCANWNMCTKSNNPNPGFPPPTTWDPSCGTPASSGHTYTGTWECIFKCQDDPTTCRWKGMCKTGSGKNPQGPCTQADYDQVCDGGIPYYPEGWFKKSAFFGDDASSCAEMVEDDEKITCDHPGGAEMVEEEKIATEGANTTAVVEVAAEANDDSMFVCTYQCGGQSVMRCMASCPEQYGSCEEKTDDYQVPASNCEAYADRMKSYGGSDFASRSSAHYSIAGKTLYGAVQQHLAVHQMANGSLAVLISDDDFMKYAASLEQQGLSKAEGMLCDWATEGAGAGTFCKFAVNNPLTHWVNKQIVDWPVAKDLTHSVCELTHGDVRAAVDDVKDAVNTGVHEIEDVCKKAGQAIGNFIRHIF